MTVLLDTGSAGDYIHRRLGVYERAREAVTAGHRVGIGLPVLAELWFGVENSKHSGAERVRLRRCCLTSSFGPSPSPGRRSKQG